MNLTTVIILPIKNSITKIFAKKDAVILERVLASTNNSMDTNTKINSPYRTNTIGTKMSLLFHSSKKFNSQFVSGIPEPLTVTRVCDVVVTVSLGRYCVFQTDTLRRTRKRYIHTLVIAVKHQLVHLN
eukprot:TRINITY_DN5516_c1_g1_i1.p1 TRINITY_DN5516_c1_g1~~TRINITY_DN5516_c1_g1_i1.p1  ORF type:complete len:128 (+),score=7.29 TRINITY_DN5516_c1_g1_i1:351-734(+)